MVHLLDFPMVDNLVDLRVDMLAEMLVLRLAVPTDLQSEMLKAEMKGDRMVH